MASIAARHQVVLKDQAGLQVALFDKYTKIELQHIVNDVGYFTVEFYDDGDSRFNLFALDGQVEIWRAVPGLGLGWYLEFEGLFRKRGATTDSNGRKTLVFSGFGYNHLLSRRCIGYKQGTIRAEKNDYLEDVMKEYVEENCAAGGAHASRIANGQFPGFTVQALSADHALTPNWRGERAFQNLLDVLQELAIYGSGTIPTYRAVDFAVVSNGAAAFIFNTYMDQLGTDHSESSSDPVIFSVEMGNLQEIDYEDDHSTEATRAIVLGRGERSTRKVIARNSAVAAAVSPWNVIETAVSASLNEFEYQLNNAGDAALKEKSAITSFNGTPIQQPSTMYGLHYSYGDIVTVRNKGVSFDKKIISAKISVDEQGVESIDIGWEDITR